PNELHLVNPLTRTDDFVPLTSAPTALALSANGQRAAVGHANAVSIVDLQSRTVEKVIPTSIIPATLVLAGDWVYAFSARGGQVARISTGVPATLDPGATFSRLTASGNLAYFGLAGYGNPARIDVSAGGTSAHYFSLSSGICNGLWTSDDDRRVYSACGDVFRTSEVLEQDLAPNGKLSAATYGVLWVTHAANRQQFAALVRPDGTATPPPPDVQIYGDDGLPLLGRLRLSPRIEAGITYPLAGKWLFWNQGATHLFAVAQINLSGLTAEQQASPPLSQFSVETVPVADVLGCTISVTPQSPTLSGAGGTVEVSVQTAPACSWTAAVTTATWLTITTPSGSPDLFYSSAGPATLILRAERNNTGAPRSATVTIADTSITVTQPVPDPLVVAVTSVSALAFTHTATVQVTATGPGLPWTAFSNVPWITILDSPNRFGTSAISYRVAGNSGPPRTGTMTVAGRTVTINQAAASLSDGFRFVPVTPCRIADTRLAGGAFGQPVMQPGTQRDFPVPSSSCGIPATARAYSLNVTVVPHEPLGYLTLWPAGQPRPFVSTLNSFDGRIKANAAIVPAGASGAISAFVTNRADVILDINGYFVSSTVNADALGYVRVTPCRPIDTSSSGATLAAGETRTFNLAFACSGSVSSLAKALALNVTATPRSGGLAYLTVWPTGQPRPTVSTLNSFTGVRTSNAAIVATGANTSISVYVTDRADIAIDVVGYFSDSSTIGASFFPLAPCRLLDTRTADGPFGGPALTGNLPRNILLPAENACGIPDRAHGLSLNATVVPPGQLNSLTLLPYLQQAFTPSQTTTLHAPDGVVTSNAALVTSLPGLYLAITAYASAQTHLILDVNGYFALIYAP
ncbi:MAG: BACON domain-containing protein, partial [Bryobacterales bacterium]|nr:BACON domain-containing protein [Bryobacterales bacterium]